MPVCLLRQQLNRELLGGNGRGVTVSEHLRVDLRGSSGQGDRLVQMALLLLKEGQRMQRFRRFRVLLTQLLFSQSQCLEVERFGLLILALLTQERCQALSGWAVPHCCSEAAYRLNARRYNGSASPYRP